MRRFGPQPPEWKHRIAVRCGACAERFYNRTPTLLGFLAQKAQGPTRDILIGVDPDQTSPIHEGDWVLSGVRPRNRKLAGTPHGTTLTWHAVVPLEQECAVWCRGGCRGLHVLQRDELLAKRGPYPHVLSQPVRLATSTPRGVRVARR